MAAKRLRDAIWVITCYHLSPWKWGLSVWRAGRWRWQAGDRVCLFRAPRLAIIGDSACTDHGLSSLGF
jgi:hypothetical protein